MKLQYFGLKKSEPIILYGLGTTGKKLLSIIQNYGFKNIFLVDQRADSIIEYENNKIYSLEDMALHDWKEYPVFIGIHDSWQHDEVMRCLVRMGYCKFIAIPMDMGERIYKKEIRKIYNAIFDGKLDSFERIPYFASEENERKYIINVDDDYVQIWLSSFFIFSVTKKWAIEECKDDFYYNKSDDLLKTYVDICMFDHTCYRLFSCFIDGRDILKNIGYQYIAEKHTKLNNMEVGENFYQERRNLYDFYCRELEEGMSYFIDNPLDVGLNESGNRVNIQEGHHRISFLIVKRYARIPVRMLKREFENINIIADLTNTWCKKNKYPNILEDNFSVIAKYRDMIEFFYLCIEKRAWRNWNFLIYGDAFLAQHLQKEKADVTLLSEDDDVDKINKILNIDNIRIVKPQESKELEKKFDCIILQNEKMRLNKKEIYRYLAEKDIQYLIWYSGEHPKEEKQWIEKNVKKNMHYNCGRYYFMDGIEYEWGFYITED